MKTVYVAGKLDRYQDIIKLQNKLRSRGYAIEFDWAAKRDEEIRTNHKISQEERARLALDMGNGAANADVFVLISTGRRGAHTEFGIAWGLGNSVILVLSEDPSDDVSFYLLPGVKLVRSQEELLEAM